MSWNPQHPEYLPDRWKTHPQLTVPPEALLPTLIDEEREFLVHFYKVFRHEEKKNHHQELASLGDIYERFVHEWEMTVQRVRDGSIKSVSIKNIEERPIKSVYFKEVLSALDQQFLRVHKQPMERKENRHLQDMTFHEKAPNPVISLEKDRTRANALNDSVRKNATIDSILHDRTRFQ